MEMFVIDNCTVRDIAEYNPDELLVNARQNNPITHFLETISEDLYGVPQHTNCTTKRVLWHQFTRPNKLNAGFKEDRIHRFDTVGQCSSEQSRYTF